jgi:hypothetical protein
MAMARCENDSSLKDLTDLLTESLQSDVLGTLRTMAQFLPKEIDVNIGAQDSLITVLASISEAAQQLEHQEKHVLEEPTVLIEHDKVEH